MKRLPFLLTLGCLLFTLILTAQTVYVKSGATGNNDGSSWTDAFTSLQSALDLAPSGADIWIAAGTYVPGERSQSFQIDKPLHLFGGFSGTESQLTDREPEQNITILSGDNQGNDPGDDPEANRTDNSIHVIQLLAESSGGSLNDLLISGGYADRDAAFSDPNGYGGGVYNLAAAFQFNTCVFQSNSAREGGGFANRAGSTDGLFFNNCVFRNNLAEDGGGISSSEEGAKLNITACQFQGNTATGYSFSAGGAVWGISTLEITISQSQFENNSALDLGGAVALFNDPLATFTELTFRANSTETGNGGALSVVNRGRVSISASRFEQNQSANNGGAASFDLSEPYLLEINTTEFHANEAARGGGAVYADGQFIADRMKITGSLFTENTCIAAGGALNISGSPLSITGSRFENNAAGSGGAISTILNSVLLDLDSCDFIENTARFAGALELYRGSSSSVANSRFVRNKATAGSAGAIAYDQDKSSTGPQPEHSIDACIFDGNVAEREGETGGFGSIILGFNANVDITNALFINNEAMIAGGIYNLAFDTRQDVISLLNCTFAANDNGAGATLMADNVGTEDMATYQFQNTIFADEGNSFGNEGGETMVVSKGGNICTNNSLNDILMQEKDLPETDPVFRDNAADFSPANDSPAINAGVNSGAPATDLVGYPRDALVDIGAYESQEVTDVYQHPESGDRLSVFPNPVGNRLQLRLQGHRNGQLMVRVLDASGKLFTQAPLSKDSQTLDAVIRTDALPAGLYLLQLSSDSGTSSVKFIKK